MATYYAKRAVEILRKKGLMTLLYRTKKTTTRKLFRTLLNIKYGLKYNAYTKSEIYELPVSLLNYNITTAKIRREENIHYIPPVLSGEWHKKKKEIYRNYKYVSFYKRFVENKSWEQTPYYERIADDFASSRIKTKYPSSDTPVEALEIYDGIYNDMKANGFREKYHFIGCIGPNGDYIIIGGRHRLALVKILDIDKVPVWVHMRHEHWQGLRDKIHKNGLPEGREDLRDHPDLQDILD